MTCKAGALAATLTTSNTSEDRTLLARLLDGARTDGRGREVPATVLARALDALGLRVSATAIKDHRRGVCSCRRG